MFCPKCGNKLAADDMYCSKCGKAIVAGGSESVHEAAKTAFDTTGPGGAAKRPMQTATKPKSGGGAFTIILGIIIAGVIIAAVANDQSGGGGTSSSGYRTCITSYYGKLPECSDGPGGDGTYKKTRVNNKVYDSCKNVSVSGACVK